MNRDELIKRLPDVEVQPIDYVELSKRYFAKFGDYTGLMVAVEEMSELQQAICKVLRGEGDDVNLAEEMADVELCLRILRCYYGKEMSSMVDKIRVIKAERIMTTPRPNPTRLRRKK